MLERYYDQITIFRQNPDKTQQYNIQKDTDKVIFCNHCSSMTEEFKMLNLRNEFLMQENVKLRVKLQKMKSKGQTKQDVQIQKK